jgi:hypothetical protein
MLLAPLSTLTDEAKQTGALQRGTPLSYGLSTAAFLGDLFNPSIDIPVAAGVRGVGAGVKAATDPTNQARLNAMMGRLYHGNRNEPWSVAASRPFDERVGNWFSADLFSTPDFKLASSYGPNAVYTLRNLPSNLKILDLMPGGRTVAEQSPSLARALGNLMGGNKPFDDVSDAARHLSLTNLPNDQLNQLMTEYGFNALRHVSGQGLGGGTGRAKPVYAFFDPTGITASPVSPLNRLLYQSDEIIKDLPGAISRKSQTVGNRFVDSIDEFLRKQDPDLLTPKAQEFLAGRGNYYPSSVSSSGLSGRYVVNPSSGRTESVISRPYEPVVNALEFLNKPANAVRNARQQSINAYQQRLSEYPQLETANRRAFLESNPDLVGLPRDPTFRFRGGNVPMPPGYQPLPEPAQPGAFDFLRYMFAQ